MAISNNNSLIHKTRRNHGLEHATINILEQRSPGLRLAGYSTPFGFSIIGPVKLDALVSAIEEAKRQVGEGRRRLVIHDRCGTNLACGGLLTGVAAWLAMLGVRRNVRSYLERLPLVIFLSTLAMYFAPAAGTLMQEKITTSSHINGVEIMKISRGKIGKHPRFFIKTG